MSTTYYVVTLALSVLGGIAGASLPEWLARRKIRAALRQSPARGEK